MSVHPITTTLVGRAHPYTKADVPWRMDTGGRKGRLFRYLRGGGIRAFAGSTAADLADFRQTRFLIVAGVLTVGWMVFLIV